jgi:hypothetical protein
MKTSILAAMLVAATSAHAECTDFPQKCSEIQMLIEMDLILDKECSTMDMSKPVCRAYYMSGDILLKRGYTKNGTNVWHKAKPGEKPIQAE